MAYLLRPIGVRQGHRDCVPVGVPRDGVGNFGSSGPDLRAGLATDYGVCNCALPYECRRCHRRSFSIPQTERCLCLALHIRRNQSVSVSVPAATQRTFDRSCRGCVTTQVRDVTRPTRLPTIQVPQPFVLS